MYDSTATDLTSKPTSSSHYGAWPVKGTGKNVSIFLKVYKQNKLTVICLSGTTLATEAWIQLP